MIANFQPPATSSWPKLSISVYEGGEYKLTLNETCYSEKYNKQIRCERACVDLNIVAHIHTLRSSYISSILIQ